jgi:hypothetical protein
MNGVHYSSTALEYMYETDAEVRSIEPSSGPTRGGTVVSVLGHNLQKLGRSTCVFGS